jgi:hypothetical protein
MKRLAFSVSSILIGAILAFLLGEVFLRIYQHADPVFVFPDRSYNRFRGKPFADDYNFKLNSKGFKDVEYEQVKKPGAFRIIGIGDSFTFGVVPYQYNFLTQLEDRLQGRGWPVEIINMGIPGLSPRDYLAVFVHEGLSLAPDMLLLCLFVGNDFDEDKGPPAFQSYVVSLIRYHISLVQRWKGNVFHPASAYHDDQQHFSEAAYLDIEKQRSQIFRRNNKVFARSFANSLEYLRQIHGLCREHKINLGVVIIPDELQVNPQLQKEVMQGVQDATPEDWDFRLPNRMLTAELQQLGIRFVDLLEPFERKSQKMRLYKPLDSHWNIEGNTTAADVLAEFVVPMLNRVAKEGSRQTNSQN